MRKLPPQLSHYADLAGEVIPPEVCEKFSAEDRAAIGLIVYRAIRKIKALMHDEHGMKICAALNEARARGVQLGRPKSIPEDRAIAVAKLREEGLSWRQICSITGLSKGSAQSAHRRGAIGRGLMKESDALGAPR